MVGRLFSRTSFVSHRLPSPARPRIRLRLEELEARTLLSASATDAVVTPLVQSTDSTQATPQTGNGPGGGFSPSQIQSAYQYPTGYNGSGQTIAIVDAYNDPNIYSDVQTFNNQFGLGDTSFLTVINQSGTVINPAVSGAGVPKSNSSWGGEISLDVEWAHAVAPGANIVLVEANSSSTSDLMTAVNTASGYSVNGIAVSVVSMSWGAREFSGETSSANDGVFASHPNITYVASSGDNGSPPIWPAVSPYVVAVGGTNLYLTPTNAYSSETGWGNGLLSSKIFGGSGGGISSYESQPSYQSGVDTPASTTKRLSPDVAYDASPSTGFSVYDSYGYSGWLVVGGTSAGAPQWSAIFAIVNQERGAAGPIGSQALPALYSLYNNSSSYSTDFHDITSGNNGYAAGKGYDLVTGIGTPQVTNVAAALASYSGTSGSALVKTGTSSTGSNILVGHHDLLAPTTGDVSAPNAGNGTSATGTSTTTAINAAPTAVAFVSSNAAVFGSTNTTPFPVASAVFGQATTLATPLTVGASGTTGALASFTPFTGLLGTVRSDTAHATGGYNDSTSSTATNDYTPAAPAIPDPDLIEATPVPAPPAGAMNDPQSFLQAPAGCDACFANEEAMLALGGDSEDNAPVEDDAAVVRSAGMALIGLGAILSGFWMEQPGTTEEARRRAALLLLSGK